ncbi:uncharacterized protein [Clytia hemisphaerica]|uniref:Uncharacterized protein n=1 Tax=Clytia hemisphaerica TaxID=252671 RepID=A0A7M6DMV0_9CNID
MHYNIGILLIVWSLLQQTVSHNRTVYKYIRDGCIQCRQINRVVVEQQTNGLRSFRLDHFLKQLHLYHDHSTGKFFSLRNTCRKLNQKFTRHKTVLPPLHPLSVDKEQSPLWDVKILNQVKNEKVTREKDRQPSFYSPHLLFLKLTNFVKDLFKREAVCLQCGKHGKFVPPYTTKTSMLKKFMQLVFGPSTKRNIRENICAVPVFRIGKTRLQNRPLAPVEHEIFQKSPIFINKSVDKLSVTNLSLDVTVPVLTNTTSAAHRKSVTLTQTSLLRKIIKNWWKLFSLFGKGQCFVRRDNLPKESGWWSSFNLFGQDVRIKDSLPQNSHDKNITVKKVQYNNWWALVSLLSKGVSPSVIKDVESPIEPVEEVPAVKIVVEKTIKNETEPASLETNETEQNTEKPVQDNTIEEESRNLDESNQTSELFGEDLEAFEDEKEEDFLTDSTHEQPLLVTPPEETQTNNNKSTSTSIDIVYHTLHTIPLKPKMFILKWQKRYYGGEVAESWLTFILIFAMLLSLLRNKRSLKEHTRQTRPLLRNTPTIPPPLIPKKKTFELEWIVAIAEISIANLD